jgi:hypothetical protein
MTDHSALQETLALFCVHETDQLDLPLSQPNSAHKFILQSLQTHFKVILSITLSTAKLAHDIASLRGP